MNDVDEQENVTFVYHTFGLGETIQAIIKKYNNQNIPADVMESAIVKYNTLNEGYVPRLGNKVKIPLVANN